jgi:hypothetical protein
MQQRGRQHQQRGCQHAAEGMPAAVDNLAAADTQSIEKTFVVTGKTTNVTMTRAALSETLDK